MPLCWFAPSRPRVFHEPRPTYPVLSVNEVARRTDLSFPTAAKGLMDLVRAGIARELTGQRRNPVFAYDRHLAILGEGTEPLRAAGEASR
jgi:predicted transcriptional regulator